MKTNSVNTSFQCRKALNGKLRCAEMFIAVDIMSVCSKSFFISFCSIALLSVLPFTLLNRINVMIYQRNK